MSKARSGDWKSQQQEPKADLRRLVQSPQGDLAIAAAVSTVLSVV
jgi:hypothetical protein